MAYEGEDRRGDDRWRAEVRRQIEDMNVRLDENTSITHAIKQNTDEIVEFFQAGKGFFAVVRAVGGVARWVAIIAAASGIAWGIAKFGIGQVLADLGITKLPPK